MDGRIGNEWNSGGLFGEMSWTHGKTEWGWGETVGECYEVGWEGGNKWKARKIKGDWYDEENLISNKIEIVNNKREIMKESISRLKNREETWYWLLSFIFTYKIS